MRLTRVLGSAGLFKRSMQNLARSYCGYDYALALSKPKERYAPQDKAMMERKKVELELAKHINEKGEMSQEGKELYTKLRQKSIEITSMGIGLHM